MHVLLHQGQAEKSRLNSDYLTKRQQKDTCAYTNPKFSWKAYTVRPHKGPEGDTLRAI